MEVGDKGPFRNCPAVSGIVIAPDPHRLMKTLGEGHRKLDRSAATPLGQARGRPELSGLLLHVKLDR